MEVVPDGDEEAVRSHSPAIDVGYDGTHTDGNDIDGPHELDEAGARKSFGNPGEAAARGVRSRKTRGRHAKDPLAHSIHFECTRLEDLESHFRGYLENPDRDEEHTTLEFVFPVTAAFMIPAREVLGKGDPNDKNTPFVYSLFKKSAISVVDALHTITDPKEQMLAQRRISKTVVDAIAEVDGFRYSFHNQWLSRDDNANRFSYYCNDSILNKGRAANEGVTKVQNGVRIRKPVFECEGGIWVKFSVTKNHLEVHYKHIRLHQTFDERAPVPRNGSLRRKVMQIFHPEKLPHPKPKMPKVPKSPKEKKRKAEGPDKPSRKSRATEPITQPDVDGATQHDRERQNSLNPLFDFLGSAARVVQDGQLPETPTPNTERVTESAPPNTEGLARDDEPSIEASTNAASKSSPFPGMMTGFVGHENDLNWGSKTRKPKTKRTGKAKGNYNDTAVAAEVSPSAEAAPNSITQPLAEMDLLKQKLQEMERKVQELEAEKARPGHAASAQTWMYRQAPIAPPPGGYYPPYHGPAAPQVQWHYPPVPTPHPSHAQRPPLSHHGQSQAPAQYHMPPAPGATHPHAYHHQNSQQLPPTQPPPRQNTSPSYGFVPNPTDLIAHRIRPHLQPSEPQRPIAPGKAPSPHGQPPPQNANFLSQLTAAEESPSTSQPQEEHNGRQQPELVALSIQANIDQNATAQNLILPKEQWQSANNQMNGGGSAEGTQHTQLALPGEEPHRPENITENVKTGTADENPLSATTSGAASAANA